MKNSLKFWTISDDRVNINLSDIIDFLSENGFGTYYNVNSNENDPIIIHITNGVVSRFNKTAVIYYCLDFILNADETDYNKKRLKREFIHRTKFFKTSDLYFLPKITPNFIKDDLLTAHFFFKNTSVKISRAHGLETIDYSKINGAIWDFQIIPRNFTIVNQEITPHEPFGNAITCEFADFLWDLCNDEGKDGLTSEKYMLLGSIIGYLMHDYKDPSFSKAVVFFDYSTDERMQGGTGKTLLARSFKELKAIKIIDGKLFSTSSNFAFSGIDESTRIIVFDDVKDSFDFKNLYSIITSGLTVENKFQNSFHIPSERSPKIVITSNHAITGVSNSFKRRILEFDFSDYYIKNQAPDKKFKHLLFDGWNNGEWNLFYNLILKFVKTYLEFGIYKPQLHFLERKKSIMATSKSFVDYISYFLGFTYDSNKKRYNKTVVYNDFLQKYPDTTMDISMNTFTKWLKIYADINGIKLIEKHSDSNYYFKFEE